MGRCRCRLERWATGEQASSRLSVAWVAGGREGVEVAVCHRSSGVESQVVSCRRCFPGRVEQVSRVREFAGVFLCGSPVADEVSRSRRCSMGWSWSSRAWFTWMSGVRSWHRWASTPTRCGLSVGRQVRFNGRTSQAVCRGPGRQAGHRHRGRPRGTDPRHRRARRGGRFVLPALDRCDADLHAARRWRPPASTGPAARTWAR
jgi:hypothetical protein